MFEMIAEEMLNSFSIAWKISDLRKKLESKRTPKKYIEPLKAEIERLERLYLERKRSEKKSL